MKTKLIAITAGMVLVTAALGSAFAEERIISVPGDKTWTNTDMRVRAGDRIDIRASGTIDWGKGEIGPEGTSGGGLFRPISDSPAGGLIGRVQGITFFLGDDRSVDAPADGYLELGINDDKVSDNSGEFRVRVRTDRGTSGSSRYASGFGKGDDSRDGSWTEGSRPKDGDDRYDHDGDRSQRDNQYRHNAGSDGHDRDSFWWQGRVDGTDQLIIQGKTLRVKHLAADPIQRQDYHFSAPIPEREIDYRLDVKSGRGRVRLLQQPDSSNEWTAVLLVDDSDEGGAANYEFELSWRRPRSNPDRAWDGVFRWRGKVDIGCRVSISGKTSSIKDEGGRGTHADFAEFTSAMPATEVPVSLRKIRGRGKVRLVDSPNHANGYTAVVEIEDDKGGSDSYEFELGWRK